MNVIKRNGKIENFNVEKIAQAMLKAYLNVDAEFHLLIV
jgi:transcriptional regulator NrdR family protein